ncbi:VOC family protein [Paenibacillus sp. LHD-117]|uniref:bleomycin resistance protein n=1 Tax=Paenibacillus sp. LHD-117 TaxID=3071412 RepID=UPI0027E16AAC|nr:VOC family protein [Paenibacillus sp. LHD-117]MDQ6423607.1 VOC family protein [Paenibacillus sp. LHD-117]
MSTNRNGTAIPIFPCRSIDEQLSFYQALGFEVTYRQAKPNLYACVRHRIAELHFFVLKQLEPSNSYSMCYVSVPDVDAVYKEFCENLKRTYQKVPSKGFPRITKLNNLAEDRRFNLIDPAGNRLLIGQKHAASAPMQIEQTVAGNASKFANAFDTAYRLAYAKDELADAAKVLDLVLGKNEEASETLLFKAFVLRADIAVSMDEFPVAKAFANKADRLSLTEQALEEVPEAAERLDEVKAALLLYFSERLDRSDERHQD